MTNQNYLIIESNVVTNIVVWDGNTNTWQPPSNSIQLTQDNTPAIVWELDKTVTPYAYKLVEQIGVGAIGFTWDGTVLTTNEPQPIVPIANDQPSTFGTTTI